MILKIKNRFDGRIIYQAEAESFAALTQAAVKADVNLPNANLSYANLRNANLSDANLPGADLSNANLPGANLSYADLRNANLYGANLPGADLSNANLPGANLPGADLRNANLRNANLHGADLSNANLRNANLRNANLRNAKNISDQLNAESSIVPETGQFEGWKKCRLGVIVRVGIFKDAKRSNSTGRKCRASRVKVFEVIGASEGVSIYSDKIVYRVGEIVKCDVWNEDRWTECGGGIHFFITRKEAELYAC
jgi:uncharacterized protein YjbI with pentapeptide repeats